MEVFQPRGVGDNGMMMSAIQRASCSGIMSSVQLTDVYISDYIPYFSVCHSLYHKHIRRLKIPFTSLALWCYKVELYSRSISLTNYLTTAQCWTYWFPFVKQHWTLSVLGWVTSLIIWGFCFSALYSCLFSKGFYRVSPVGRLTERARRCEISAADLVNFSFVIGRPGATTALVQLEQVGHKKSNIQVCVHTRLTANDILRNFSKKRETYN